MTRDLSRLLIDYAKAEPRRAFGGLYALAGFDYQLRLYVARLAEALACGGDTIDGAGALFVEALSDLAEADSQGLVCIQIKRTLTAAALKSAAQEALAIDRFLATQDPAAGGPAAGGPAAGDQVRFSLVAARGDASLGWDDLPAPEAAALAPLRAADRLLPPRLEPDPAWRAVVAIWERLDDPYGWLHGRDCLRGADLAQDACYEITARNRCNHHRSVRQLPQTLVPHVVGCSAVLAQARSTSDAPPPSLPPPLRKKPPITTPDCADFCSVSAPLVGAQASARAAREPVLISTTSTCPIATGTWPAS